MRVAAFLACLWPGLVQAWRLGSLRGLGLAVVFGGTLNLALICSLVWPRWPIASLPAGTTAEVAWLWVLGLGIVGLRWTSRDWPRLFPNQSKTDPQIDNWFREAQQAYLQGHWIEAETLLAQLLKRQPADADARLLLASVQRRSGARKQARQTLTELQPVATRWHWEIAAELEQITELEEEKSTAAPQPQRKAA